MELVAPLPPWNAVRLDVARPPRRGHVESYFLKLNDGKGERALWLKATLLARPGERPVAEAWAIAFRRGGPNVAVKVTVPAEEARFSRDGLDVRVAGLTIREGETTGDLRRGDDRIAWNLRFTSREPPLVPFAYEAMYRGPFPQSKLVSPIPDARFEGEITAFGEQVAVSGWRGMQGHNWGRSHAHLYAWAHVNSFEEDREVVFEGVTARVRAGGFVLPPTTLIAVRHRGVRYEWTRPTDLLSSRGVIDVASLTWTFSASSDIGSIQGELRGDPADFVGLRYENPIGPATACLNSKIATAKIRFVPRGRPALVLSSREAALEFGTKGTPPVPIVV